MTEHATKPLDKALEAGSTKEVFHPDAAITNAEDNKVQLRKQILQGLKALRLTQDGQNSFVIDRTSDGKGIEEDKRPKRVEASKPASELTPVTFTTHPISIDVASDKSLSRWCHAPEKQTENARSKDVLPAHSPVEKQLVTTTSEILNSAVLHFGSEKIDRLQIAPGDLGSALSVAMLGPDVCQRLGADAVRQLGRRLLVFGFAPAIGAAGHAQEELQHPMNVIGDAVKNFAGGTLASAVVDMCHPVIGATALAGGAAALINDQLHSPENVKRNQALQQIDAALSGASNKELIALANESKGLLANDVYKGTFGTATAGVGLPGGSLIKEELSETFVGLVDKKRLMANLVHLTDEAWQGLKNVIPAPEAVTNEGIKIRLDQGERPGYENVLFAQGTPTLAGIQRGANMVSDMIVKSDSIPLTVRLKELSKASNWLNDIADMEFSGKKMEEASTLTDALSHAKQVEQCIESLNKRLGQPQRDVCNPATQSEMQSIRLKPAGDRTNLECNKLEEFDLKQRFMEHTIKEVLKTDFGWDGLSPGFRDNKVYFNLGDNVQKDISNQLTELVTRGRNDPEVEKIFAQHGLSAKDLDRFVGLSCPKNSAADHVGIDYLLVDKKTGQFYPLDITASAGLPEGKLVSSVHSEGALTIQGDKHVPSDRMDFIIAATGTEGLTDRKAYLQLAVAIADMMKNNKGLSIFETPPPSADASRSWMRKIIEMDTFKSGLMNRHLSDWGRSVTASMYHVFKPENRE